MSTVLVMNYFQKPFYAVHEVHKIHLNFAAHIQHVFY